MKTLIDPTSMAVLLLVWPLVLNLLFIIKPKSAVAFYSMLIGSTLGMALAAFWYGPSQEPIRIGRWIALSLDTPAWIFVILVYLCWSLTLIYSIGYISAHMSHKAEQFHRYMSATLSLAIGAGLADNFFTLLAFYIASIPTIVPLLTLRHDEASNKAAKFYVLSTLWPALLIALPTIAISFPLDLPFEQIHINEYGWGHGRAGLVLALIIIGFSKNCVAPFLMWLPRSSIAAAPVTALIHSVASVQVASIALFKIGKYVYGVDLLSDLCDHFFETGWLLFLCGGTALYTAYRAWKTPDLKQRFSFSTVGQLSYIITAILVGTHQSMQGAMLHIITHSIAKLNLFFCAGAYLTSFGSVQAPIVAKAIPGRRWVGVAAVLSGLSIGGFPFLAGYYSKDLMLLEELHRHHYSAAAFLLVGSIINFIYIFPLIKATLRKKTADTPTSEPIPLAMKLAIIICSLLIVAMSVFSYNTMRYINI